MFQQFHLLPQISALENVMLPMVYAGVASNERRDRAALALDKVGSGQPNQQPSQSALWGTAAAGCNCQSDRQ